MTPDEAKSCLKAICDKIVQQNVHLITRLDDSDFDPGIELDNTRNGSGYLLTDFFDILKRFPYGCVPCELTDEVVATTDELLDKIRRRYGACMNILKALVTAGQAFRASKRIWRIRNPIEVIDQEIYKSRLDVALDRILNALDDLDFELMMNSLQPRPAPTQKRTRGHGLGKGPQSPFRKAQREAFDKFLERHPITPSVTVLQLAKRCWIEHKAAWDAAAADGTGYANYKTLSRAV